MSNDFEIMSNETERNLLIIHYISYPTVPIPTNMEVYRRIKLPTKSSKLYLIRVYPQIGIYTPLRR